MVKRVKQQSSDLSELLQWLESLVIDSNTPGTQLSDIKINVPSQHQKLLEQLFQDPQKGINQKAIWAENFQPEKVEEAIKKALLAVQQYNGEKHSSKPQKGYNTLKAIFENLGLNFTLEYVDLSRSKRLQRREAIDKRLFILRFDSDVIDIAIKSKNDPQKIEEGIIEKMRRSQGYTLKRLTADEIKALLVKKKLDIVAIFSDELQKYKEEAIYALLKTLHTELIHGMTDAEKNSIRSVPDDIQNYSRIFGQLLERKSVLVKQYADRFAYILSS